MPIFFVEKMQEAFAVQKLLSTAKASLIFSTKNISVLGYKVVKHWHIEKVIKSTVDISVILSILWISLFRIDIISEV